MLERWTRRLRATRLDEIFHGIQAGINHFDYLLIGRDIFLYHPLHYIRKDVQLRFDNSHIDIFLTFKIGVEGSPTFFRSESNIIHRGIFNTHFSKQLTGYIH